MKVFITGINGFVGKYMSEFLVSKDFVVAGMDLAEKFEGNVDVNYHKVDILNLKEMCTLLKLEKPSMVIHLAGFSSVKKSFNEPELCKKINVEGTKNLLDSIIIAGINPKILVVSSAEIYGIPKLVPILESSELRPNNPYARSRKEQEDLCLKYVKDKKLHIIISRSFPHIGPGQSPIFVTADFAKQISEIENALKEPIIKVGNLEAKRDFTDVRDIVKSYLLALKGCKSGEIYNICSGNSYSIREILNKLLSFSKVQIEIKKDSEKMRPSDIPILKGDNSKFIKETGWNPKIKIEDSLKDILNYWRKNV